MKRLNRIQISGLLLALVSLAAQAAAQQKLQAQQQQQVSSARLRPQSEQQEQHPAPEPYSFSYSAESNGGLSTHVERGDGSGKVTGYYTIMGEDGRERRVDYVADENGYRATIKTNEVGTRSESSADAAYEASLPTPKQLEAAKVSLEQYQYLEETHRTERERHLSRAAAQQQQQRPQWQQPLIGNLPAGAGNEPGAIAIGQSDDDWRARSYARSSALRQRDVGQPAPANGGASSPSSSSSSSSAAAATYQSANQLINNGELANAEAVAAAPRQTGSDSGTGAGSSRELRSSKFSAQLLEQQNNNNVNAYQQQQQPQISSPWQRAAGAANKKPTTVLQRQLEAQFMQQASQLTDQDYPRQTQYKIDTNEAAVDEQPPFIIGGEQENRQQQQLNAQQQQPVKFQANSQSQLPIVGAEQAPRQPQQQQQQQQQQAQQSRPSQPDFSTGSQQQQQVSNNNQVFSNNNNQQQLAPFRRVSAQAVQNQGGEFVDVNQQQFSNVNQQQSNIIADLGDQNDLALPAIDETPKPIGQPELAQVSFVGRPQSQPQQQQQQQQQPIVSLANVTPSGQSSYGPTSTTTSAPLAPAGLVAINLADNNENSAGIKANNLLDGGADDQEVDMRTERPQPVSVTPTVQQLPAQVLPQQQQQQLINQQSTKGGDSYNNLIEPARPSFEGQPKRPTSVNQIIEYQRGREQPQVNQFQGMIMRTVPVTTTTTTTTSTTTAPTTTSTTAAPVTVTTQEATVAPEIVTEPARVVVPVRTNQDAQQTTRFVPYAQPTVAPLPATSSAPVTTTGQPVYLLQSSTVAPAVSQYESQYKGTKGAGSPNSFSLTRRLRVNATATANSYNNNNYNNNNNFGNQDYAMRVQAPAREQQVVNRINYSSYPTQSVPQPTPASVFVGLQPTFTESADSAGRQQVAGQRVATAQSANANSNPNSNADVYRQPEPQITRTVETTRLPQVQVKPASQQPQLQPQQQQSLVRKGTKGGAKAANKRQFWQPQSQQLTASASYNVNLAPGTGASQTGGVDYASSSSSNSFAGFGNRVASAASS